MKHCRLSQDALVVSFTRANSCMHVPQGLSLGCQSDWGVTPRPEWARVMLGGKSINNASNILFSNGLLDPWHGGGVLTDVSETVVALVIPNGGHHVDLMFTDPGVAPVLHWIVYCL